MVILNGRIESTSTRFHFDVEGGNFEQSRLIFWIVFIQGCQTIKFILRAAEACIIHLQGIKDEFLEVMAIENHASDEKEEKPQEEA